MSEPEQPGKGSARAASGKEQVATPADDAGTGGRRNAKWATISRAMREREAAGAIPRQDRGPRRGGRLSGQESAVCSFRLAPHEAEVLDRAMRLLSLEARARGKPTCHKSDALRGAVLAFMNDIVANGADERHFDAIERAL